VPVDNEPNAFVDQRKPRHGQRRKRRRVLDEDQIRLSKLPQRPPQAIADAKRVDHGDRRIAQSWSAMPEERGRQVMERDPRVVHHRRNWAGVNPTRSMTDAERDSACAW
jgi:hypothetical protein